MRALVDDADEPPSHPACVLIMEAMGGIDVGASIAWFQEHGGYSDMEVIWNVVLRDDDGRDPDDPGPPDDGAGPPKDLVEAVP